MYTVQCRFIWHILNKLSGSCACMVMTSDTRCSFLSHSLLHLSHNHPFPRSKHPVYIFTMHIRTHLLHSTVCVWDVLLLHAGTIGVQRTCKCLSNLLGH